MGFGSLGISELVVIFIIVLVFFGPRRFPEIARSMGSAMREFRRSLNQIQRELEEVDPRKDIPGRELLDDIRSMKTGKWLDPNQTRVPESQKRSPSPAGPQQTGETAGSGADAPPVASEPPSGDGEDEEQLPMFDTGSEGPPAPGDRPAASDEAEPRPRPDAPATDDSRSG